jgi:hypothetical protein
MEKSSLVLVQTGPIIDNTFVGVNKLRGFATGRQAVEASICASTIHRSTRQEQLFFALLTRYAIIRLTTSPCTSVRRYWRPW